MGKMPIATEDTVHLTKHQPSQILPRKRTGKLCFPLSMNNIIIEY